MTSHTITHWRRYLIPTSVASLEWY